MNRIFLLNICKNQLDFSSSLKIVETPRGGEGKCNANDTRTWVHSAVARGAVAARDEAITV